MNLITALLIIAGLAVAALERLVLRRGNAA